MGTTGREIPVGYENPPDKTSKTEQLAARLSSFLPDILLEQCVRYDRSGVNDSYPWKLVEGEDGTTITITAPALGNGADEGAKVLHSMEGGFHGTCREIAPAVAEWLRRMGSVKSSEVFGCSNDGEFHYCAVAEVKDEIEDEGGRPGGRVLVDLGYSQPVPVAVVVDGGPVESDFYYGEGLPKGKLPKGQAYGGKVLYEAVSEGDGIVFTIKRAPEGPVIKRFELKPVNEQVDKTIVAGFPGATGSICNTRVVPAGILSGGMAKIRRTDEDYADRFGTLHGILKLGDKIADETGEVGRKVKVVVEYRN